MTYSIIKKETNKINIENLIELTKSEEAKLLQTIEESRIHYSLMDDLIIFDDHNNQLLKEPSRSKIYQLYMQISSLRSFTRTYRRRYTKENLIELNHILTLFPNSESTVKKAFKIPLGTWRKLLNEIKMMDQGLRSQNVDIIFYMF